MAPPGLPQGSPRAPPGPSKDARKLRDKLRRLNFKGREVGQEEFNEVFDCYDKDKNGSLQYSELNSFMMALIDKTSPNFKPGLQKTMSQKEMIAFSQSVEELVTKYDSNHDSVFERSELAAMLDVKVSPPSPVNLVAAKRGLKTAQSHDKGKDEKVLSKDLQAAKNGLKTPNILIDPPAIGNVVVRERIESSSSLLDEGLEAMIEREERQGDMVRTNRSKWQLLQKQGFTEWVGKVLNEGGSTYNLQDVVKGLGDGVLLPELASALTGTKVAYKRDPKLTFHKFENIQNSLNALTAHGAALNNIVACDLASGNETLCLSFLKALKTHYTSDTRSAPAILDVVRKAKKRHTGPVTKSVLEEGTSSVADVLVRCNELLSSHGLIISNLTRDWEDGELLLLIADRFAGGIYMTYQHDHPLVKNGVSLLVLNTLLDLQTEVTPLALIANVSANVSANVELND